MSGKSYLYPDGDNPHISSYNEAFLSLSKLDLSELEQIEQDIKDFKRELKLQQNPLYSFMRNCDT